MASTEMKRVKPTRPQYDIIVSRQAVNLYMAGQGSGKSHCAGYVSSILLSRFPAVRGIICANTQGQLTKSTLYRIREVWRQECGWQEYNDNSGKGCYVVDRQPPKHFITDGHNFDSYSNIISFDNGAVVFIGSLENYKALDGMEAGWAILDETKDTREQAVKQVILGRLRQKGMYVDHVGNLTDNEKETPFNPLYIFTSPARVQWINEWFSLDEYEPEIKQLIYSKTTYFSKKIGNKYVTISSSYLNADNLPANYIDNLRLNLHTSLQDMLIFGNPFSKAGGEFYKFFRRDKHVGKLTELYPEVFGTGRKPYCKDMPLYISVDENAVPYFPMGIYQMVGLTLFKIDEICAEWPDNTVDYICGEFIRRYRNHVAGVSLFGDATSQKDDVKQEKGNDLYRLIMNLLERYRPRKMVPRSNPSVAGRGDFINSVLEKEVQGCRFMIDEGCVKTISDYSNTKEAPDRGKDKKTITDPDTGRTYQPWGHLTDEGDYIMCVVWANQFRKYQYGGTEGPWLFSKPRNGRY